MKNRKLIQLLSLLSKAECEKLGLFLRSPYHNTDERLITLGDFFLSHYPEFPLESCNEEGAWQQLSPGEALNKNKLAQLMTKLTRVAEAFLTHERFSTEVFYQKVLYADMLQLRDADDLFDKASKDVFKFFDQKSRKNEEDYYWRLQHEIAVYSSNLRRSKRSKEIDTQQYQELTLSLILIEALRNILLFLSKPNQNENLLDMAHSLLKIGLNAFPALPKLAQLHVLLVDLKLKNDIAAFTRLKQFLLFYPEEVDDYSIRQGITEAINSANALFKDRATFMSHLFDFNLVLVKKGLLFEDGLITKSRFDQVIFNALYIGEIKWAEDFIKKYQAYLHPSKQEKIVAFNQAMIAFEKNEFKTCLKLTAPHHYTSEGSIVALRRLQLKVFYELNDFDSIDNYINTLRVFIHRAKVFSDMFKSEHQKFLHTLSILYKIKAGDKSPAALAKLEIEVHENSRMPEYRWFLEKIKELQHA